MPEKVWNSLLCIQSRERVEHGLALQAVSLVGLLLLSGVQLAGGLLSGRHQFADKDKTGTGRFFELGTWSTA